MAECLILDCGFEFMIKKAKLFYEWFFRDKLVLPYPQVDKVSKQQGKVLSILCGVGWIIFVLVIVVERPGEFLIPQILFYTLWVHLLHLKEV